MKSSLTTGHTSGREAAWNMSSEIQPYVDAGKRVYGVAKAIHKPAAAGVAAITAIAALLPQLSTAWWGPYLLVLAPCVLTVSFAWATVTSRNESLRRRLAAELVDCLHRRWFAGEHHSMDANHRVTLYVPSPSAHVPKVWKCIARSGKPEKNAKSPLGCDWPHPERDDDEAGPVVYVASTGTELDVPGILYADRDDPVTKQRYRLALKMSGTCADDRTWPGASISARTFRAKNGTVPAVIVVERRTGEPIRPTERSDCHRQHGELMQGIDTDEQTRETIEQIVKTRNPVKVELALAAVVAAALWER